MPRVIETATSGTLRRDIAEYAALLVDAVDSGAGMGFLPPLAPADAVRYWEGVARDVERGTRVVLAARADGALAGSAQLELATQANGLHRAAVQKVMVHRHHRRHGLGRALMRAIDDAAREHGRTTLWLDTFSDQEARRLYEATGWTHAGDVPAFALKPDGTLGATSIYWRRLGAEP